MDWPPPTLHYRAWRGRRRFRRTRQGLTVGITTGIPGGGSPQPVTPEVESAAQLAEQLHYISLPYHLRVLKNMPPPDV